MVVMRYDGDDAAANDDVVVDALRYLLEERQGRTPPTAPSLKCR